MIRLQGSYIKIKLSYKKNGDDGDSFNYSPPKKDLVLETRSVKPITTVFPNHQ